MSLDLDKLKAARDTSHDLMMQTQGVITSLLETKLGYDPCPAIKISQTMMAPAFEAWSEGQESVDALIAEVERLRAELAAAKAVGEWQPIETAPKEGEFLVYLEKPTVGNSIHSCVKHPNITTIGHRFAFDLPKPTHWRPLPEPPELRKQVQP